MVTLAICAKSTSILKVALLICSAWLFSLFSFLYIDVPAYFLLAIIIDSVLAFQFWRMAQFEIFPVILCVIMLCEVGFLATAVAVSFDDYWTIFVLNRSFELMLLYVIGSSIYRIHGLRYDKEKQEPPRVWRLQFIAG